MEIKKEDLDKLINEIVDKKIKEYSDKVSINPNIQYTKIRNVKSPNRAHEEDAGADYFIPEYSEKFVQDFKEKNINAKFSINISKNVCHIIIPPHEKILIPSGIKVNILDKRTFLDVKNKGGIATNFGLLKTAQVIDANFQGEMFFGLHNTTCHNVEIWTGMKIIQLVHQEYINSKYSEISNQEYDAIERTDRGEGERSSTGLN